MNDIIMETLKEWHLGNRETSYAEVEDSKRLLQRLLDIMRQCMPADDYALFSLNVRAVNDVVDDETAEREFEDYLDTHDADDELVDFDIVCEDLPLSRFSINFQKFITLVNEKYGWVFEHSLNGERSNSLIIPKGDRNCDSYISGIVSEIHWRWKVIKNSIIMKQRESIISEALAILNRKWEDISVADYDKAIEMLRSIDAYPELINAFRKWTYIKGDNGWKVKRSDDIEALRFEEKATHEGYNVTLQDWADLYEYDDGSNFKPDNTKIEILKAFYNQGSGLAALILGDLSSESSLWSLKDDAINDPHLSEFRQGYLKSMVETLKETCAYYKEAEERGYAAGYMAQSLIYHILGEEDKAGVLEKKYRDASYVNLRASYNLLRDYKKTFEYEERMYLINNNFKDEAGESCRTWLTPLPLSLMALNKDEALMYIGRIFDDIKWELRGLQ